LPEVRIVPYLMFGGTLCVAISYMLRARIEPKFDTIPARLLVMFLAFTQPLVRGWARYFTWLQFKRTPSAVIAAHELHPAGSGVRGRIGRRSYWSEEGKDRHHLLASTFALLRKKAGVIRATRGGTIGTSTSTATFGGASRCKPSPNTTAARSASRASGSRVGS
jgi:hypothetical protein